MQPTSDERREVAADFRRLGEEHSYAWTVDLGDVPAIFQDVTHYARLDGVVRADAIFDRLADLIDPTCRNKQIAYNRTAPKEFRTDNFICSECHETFCADGEGVNHPIDWAYCPNCGARVVDE